MPTTTLTTLTTTTLTTTCCIAGGGPAGMMLGILLARAGIDKWDPRRRGSCSPVQRVSGVTAKTPEGTAQIGAQLTVAADGRDSTLRGAAGLVPKDYGVAIDVLWFRLPRTKVNPPDTLAYLDSESMIITIPRADYYQAGMLIPKGAYAAIEREGLDEFRARIVRAAPFLSEVVSSLTDWGQIKLLTVQVDRLDKWYQEGLLCIGDAAHAMSPAFGVGINYAIQDAVVAACHRGGGPADSAPGYRAHGGARVPSRTRRKVTRPAVRSRHGWVNRTGCGLPRSDHPVPT